MAEHICTSTQCKIRQGFAQKIPQKVFVYSVTPEISLERGVWEFEQISVQQNKAYKTCYTLFGL